ncbi:rhomboid family intramembrane serine protease [Tenacibaculum jejuense]|uniref:Putative integral membrane protein n=1 Tax=Tenacibaculum jejuense TaxID=584609 RepID=A0A238UBB0_9FLAO|nr:rhomboid family intramembrane serine protease [Tenacibaculum jejuense]SNR16487.1 putative integral membrane protein [Tenacibaculum jejuense]
MNKIILGLILVNVLTSIKGFDDEAFFNKFKFQVGKILQGEKIRMFTSGFLHADWAHLGFNMYALYLFGGGVAVSFGNINFMCIYLVSLLFGGLYSLYRNKDNYYYSAIGASGAVSGVMFASILLFPNKSYSFIFFPFFSFPAYALGIGYLLYSIYGMKKQIGNIGHSAHLGGAIGGYAITLLLRPNVIQNNPKMLLLLGGIILVFLLFGNKIENL